GSLEISKLLLDHGADPNIQGEDVFQFRGSVTKMLLEGGEYGTALQAASYMGKLEIIALLLDKGADSNESSGII
ncbi:hypothetical protein B0H14DRAFT_2343868, partial [Mycena olivaceomarginata]